MSASEAITSSNSPPCSMSRAHGEQETWKRSWDNPFQSPIPVSIEKLIIPLVPLVQNFLSVLSCFLLSKIGNPQTLLGFHLYPQRLGNCSNWILFNQSSDLEIFHYQSFTYGTNSIIIFLFIIQEIKFLSTKFLFQYNKNNCLQNF